MSAVEVQVHADASQLAAVVAARLIATLAEAQAVRGTAAVVLTGGGLGTASLAAMAASPDRDTLDWQNLDIWWGDERFLRSGDPERNETGARAALLDHVPLDPARVHPMAALGTFADPESGAAGYAAELAAAPGAAARDGVPVFDVLLLGVGPDAHIASLFPGLPGVHVTEGSVIAVRDSPKPPPERISLTLPAICSAEEVWLVAAGAEKANALRQALTATATDPVPAALARGRNRTLALLDEAAAAELPTAL